MISPDGRVLRIGHGRFDPISGELTIGEHTSRLRPRTAALLAHLAQHAGRLVTKDELLQAVWPDVVVTEDSIVQCVKEIRHALGKERHAWIRTMPRQGYSLVASADESAAQAPPPGSAEAAATPPAAPPWLRRWRVPLVVALTIVLASVATLSWHRRPVTPQPSTAIVVLPIVNLTGDAGRDIVVDELTEDLATSLWNVQTLTVIAPRTAFTYKGKVVDVRRLGSELGVRYVLEGSLREQAGGPVLKLRLADAANASHLWSEDFAAAGGFNTLHGEVMARVARRLGLQLAQVEAQRSRRERPDDPMAADLVNQARALMRGPADEDSAALRALPLLEEAVRRDEGQAEAWILLARAHLANVQFSATRKHDLRRAADAAARALALAPDHWAAHSVHAQVLYNEGRMAQALTGFDRARAINPHGPGLLAWRGATLIGIGRPQDALAPLDEAMRISPRDPALASLQMMRGVAELHLGRNNAAIDWLTSAVDNRPDNPMARLMLASAFGSAGRVEAAREQVMHFRELRPGFTLRDFREREPSDEPAFLRQRERVYDGLRAAGMPE